MSAQFDLVSGVRGLSGGTTTLLREHDGRTSGSVGHTNGGIGHKSGAASTLSSPDDKPSGADGVMRGDRG